MTLTQKTALVAGGAGALGSVVANRLLSEGANVFATHVPSHLPSSNPAGIEWVPCDAADEHSVDQTFTHVHERVGGVDIFVNTIGGFIAGGPIASLSTIDWDAMMTLNLRTAFLLTRRALQEMAGKSYGRIIHISAMTALQRPPGRAAYAISKSGVIMLTEIAAREQSTTGVTINAIAPGIIDTPANRRDMPGEDFTKWTTPEALADMIVRLCGPESSGVSGTILHVPLT